MSHGRLPSDTKSDTLSCSCKRTQPSVIATKLCMVIFSSSPCLILAEPKGRETILCGQHKLIRSLLKKYIFPQSPENYLCEQRIIIKRKGGAVDGIKILWQRAEHVFPSLCKSCLFGCCRYKMELQEQREGMILGGGEGLKEEEEGEKCDSHRLRAAGGRREKKKLICSSLICVVCSLTLAQIFSVPQLHF